MSFPIRVVNAPFPDFVNPILSTLGCAPVAGCGNVDNLAGELQLAVSELYSVRPQDVHVYLIAHHTVVESFHRNLSSNAVPYHCRVYVSGSDVTNEIDFEDLLVSCARRFGDILLESRVASSGVKHVMALVRGNRIHTHAPGPSGFGGGYPVRLGPSDAEILLPHDMTMEQAQEINKAGQRVGGIESIESDGTVRYTDQAIACVRDVLGIETDGFSAHSVREASDELLAAYRSLVKHGTN
jgi:hypothetical protein